MKKLTWLGNGNLLLPGHKDPIASGQSATISNKLADELVEANPNLEITVEDAPDGDETDDAEASQPEGQEAEGQPEDQSDQEE